MAKSTEGMTQEINSDSQNMTDKLSNIENSSKDSNLKVPVKRSLQGKRVIFKFEHESIVFQDGKPIVAKPILDNISDTKPEHIPKAGNSNNTEPSPSPKKLKTSTEYDEICRELVTRIKQESEALSIINQFLQQLKEIIAKIYNIYGGAYKEFTYYWCIKLNQFETEIGNIYNNLKMREKGLELVKKNTQYLNTIKNESSHPNNSTDSEKTSKEIQSLILSRITINRDEIVKINKIVESSIATVKQDLQMNLDHLKNYMNTTGAVTPQQQIVPQFQTQQLRMQMQQMQPTQMQQIPMQPHPIQSMQMQPVMGYPPTQLYYYNYQVQNYHPPNVTFSIEQPAQQSVQSSTVPNAGLSSNVSL